MTVTATPPASWSVFLVIAKMVANALMVHAPPPPSIIKKRLPAHRGAMTTQIVIQTTRIVINASMANASYTRKAGAI
tara:strand:- start:670 stop:900 length:231 start_codon:yes stop_codon:yes gene_type:complete